MRAMLLDAPGRPLRAAEVERPTAGPGQLLLAVRACGVCRTDLHVADGELPHPKLPLVLGHEIVGTVAAVGEGAAAAGFRVGDRAGVPWLGWTCGECRYCRARRENLCDRARFTPGSSSESEMRAALDRAGGNISETARTLGLTRRGLYLKLRRLGMEILPDLAIETRQH